jgi:hypothetical protein
MIAMQHFRDRTTIVMVSVEPANTESVTYGHSSIYSVIKTHLYLFTIVCVFHCYDTQIKKAGRGAVAATQLCSKTLQ